MSEVKIAELFAGVGGFRLGLEGYADPRYPVFYSSNILLSIFTLPFLRIRSYKKNFPAHGNTGFQAQNIREAHL